MKKKILAVVLIFSMVLSQALPVMAQGSDLSELAGGLELRKKEEPYKGRYEKFTCPTCKKEFELIVDPNDEELKKGIKRLICPYDGEIFYPKQSGAAEAEMRYENVRCPLCGKEFKTSLDVKGLLSGQSQILVCPYDGEKFSFKAESFNPDGFSQANLISVMCPADKRVFKTYMDPQNARELVCPYDGTKFFPTPELIVSQPRGPSNVISRTTGGAVISNAGMSGLQTSSAMSQQSQPSAQAAQEEKPSKIEEQFSSHVPLTVSTVIKQYGYDIFRPVEKADSGRSKGGKSESGSSEDEGKILNKLLTVGQQSGITLGEGSLEGDVSIFGVPTDIPAIDDYILGPGDRLKVSIWGQIQDTFPVTVDVEGKIMLPKVGPIYVWGLKFSEAEQLIRENLLKVYTNIQVSVSLGRLRDIKIFVLGEAKKPGAYTVSSLSNVFHALYAAGGPSKMGSLRNIKVTRKGAPDLTVDLYNILLRGDNSQDYKVQANDTIFIETVGDVVGVAGNVKRPAIYELKGKVRLSDMIDMAGGISSVGYLQRIQLERIQDHLRKVVVDLEFKSTSDLKNSQNNLDMQDGDLVLIFPITSLRYNFISMSGNVLRPGDYELKEGMRLKDLIDKAGGILPGTYLKRAEIYRYRGDQMREIIPVSLTDLMDGKEEANVTLKEWDLVTMYSKKEIAQDLYVEIDGAVNKPGRYEMSESMKVSDLVFRAGGPARNAELSNAELFRAFSDPGPKTINFDLGKALSRESDENGKNDIALMEGDHLFVREDITKGEKVVVTISGEFKYPGKYAVEKGARMSDVIGRAGGFAKGAYLDGSVFLRESVRKAQQKTFKNFIESEKLALLQEQSSLAVGMTPIQMESRNKLIEYRQQLIDKLESTEVQGRVLTRLDPNMDKFKKSEYDIPLENGDILYVPITPSTVQIVGNVYGPGTATFSEGKGVDYYINRVGGLTKFANVHKIFIIKANGETVSAFIRAVKIKRGDVIVVPEEHRYRTLPGLVLKDLMQIIYQATLGAAVTITAVHSL